MYSKITRGITLEDLFVHACYLQSGNNMQPTDHDRSSTALRAEINRTHERNAALEKEISRLLSENEFLREAHRSALRSLEGLAKVS
jgi:cell division protein FtsB